MVTKTTKKKTKLSQVLDPILNPLSDLLNPEKVALEQRRQENLAEIERNRFVEPAQNSVAKPQAPEAPKPSVIRNEETGKPSFVLDPVTGKYTSVDAGEGTQELINKREGVAQDLAAGQANITQRQNFETQQQAIGQLGQAVAPSQTIGGGNDALGFARAAAFGGLGGGKGGALIGAIGAGAATGAAAGTVIPGAGTLAGAAIGTILGASLAIFGATINNKVKSKNEAMTLFSDASKRSWTATLNLANQGFEPSAVVNEYNVMVANIRESQRALREITKTSTGRDLTNAQQELIKVEQWLQDEPNYRLRMQLALQNPNPNLVYQIPTENEN